MLDYLMGAAAFLISIYAFTVLSVLGVFIFIGYKFYKALK